MRRTGEARPCAAHGIRRGAAHPAKGAARWLLVLLLALSWGASAAAQEGLAAGWPQHPMTDADGFLLTLPGRPIVLPADHASHPEARTEWWYVTGPLRGPAGQLFAFQATWFRRALVHEVDPGRSPLAARDVVLFHGVLTEVATGRRFLADVGSRAFEGWAHADERRLSLAVFGHRLDDEVGDGRAAVLEVSPGGASVRLELDLARSPVLLHGEPPGLSVKGERPGEASAYVSLPRIPVTGSVALPDAGPLPVTGTLWFDHEFGSMALGAGVEGWDWFSVALDDDSELMLYVLRLGDGRAAAASAGTLRRPDGGVEHLRRDDFEVTVLGHWTSPESGARYPAAWRLRVPGEDLSLAVAPVLGAQEVSTPATTGVTYWEGLCRFQGRHGEEAVSGEGFVELVGYAEPITGRFEPRR